MEWRRLSVHNRWCVPPPSRSCDSKSATSRRLLNSLSILDWPWSKYSDRRLVMRGAGASPCVYVATLGRRSRFVGAAFVVPNDAHFNSLLGEQGARRLDAGEIPGGGDGIELIDPVGRPLWLIQQLGPG